MITFTDDQLDSMLRSDEDRFVQATIDHVKRHNYADVRNIDPFSLKELVTWAMARARARGMFSSRDVIGFVSIMFEINPNFDQQHQISTAIDSLSSIASNRIDQLMELVPDTAWDEANATNDVKSWRPAYASFNESPTEF